MAILAGTQTRYDINGDREDLSDVIYDVSPDETVFLSMIGQDTADSDYTEWQTDSLEDADTGNAQLEGDEAAFSKPTATKRVGNRTQISSKTLNTSMTTEAIRKAGRRSEEAYQQVRRLKELHIDMEAICLNNQAAVAGDDTTPRTLAGLPAWLQTNTVFDTTDGVTPGADSGHTTGAPTATRTDSLTQVAFAKTDLDTVMESMWTNGGKPRILMVGPFNRKAVSSFAGLASHTVDVTKASPTFLVDTIDVYVGDFGKVRVVKNRLQRDRDVYVLDPAMLAVAYLRRMKVDKLAKTGDAKKKLAVVEYTLKVRNEAGLGGIFDRTTS